MTSITSAGKEDFELLSRIAKQTFIESHGHSAKPADINNYLYANYSEAAFKEELNDAKNIYHIISHDNRRAGYSKIILNCPYQDGKTNKITKLERIYLLKEFYNLKLGRELLQFNIKLSKSNGQTGIWLFVWKENERAVSFYKKAGFNIIGSHDFKISETHSNPNHQMLLLF